MDSSDRHPFLRHSAAALAGGAAVALGLPLLLALLFHEPLLPVLVLVGTGLVLEFGAAPAGIALGLSPAAVFGILVCTETGIFIGIFGILDAAGRSWRPASDFLDRTQQFIRRHAFVGRYGILSLVPCEILVGVYANAPVAWAMGWNRERSLALTLAAYIPCLVLAILYARSILALVSPGGVFP